jgi:hypothetical protein
LDTLHAAKHTAAGPAAQGLGAVGPQQFIGGGLQRVRKLHDKSQTATSDAMKKRFEMGSAVRQLLNGTDAGQEARALNDFELSGAPPIRQHDRWGFSLSFLPRKVHVSIADANNNQSVFIYEAFGRVMQKTYPDTTPVDHVYDLVGEIPG